MTTITLTRGQRLKLTDLVPDHQAFQLGMAGQGPGLVIDFAGFGLDAQGTLSDDRYMTFFNQPETPCGAVRLDTPVGDQAGFTLTLSRLPPTIARLVFTAAIDGPGTMSKLTQGSVRWLVKGQEVARFPFTGADFAAERALMLLELYRKDGGWRVAMIGQGFNGGLDALVRHFGGTITEATPEAKPNRATPPVPVTAQKQPPVVAPSPPPAVARPLSLAKITLKKPGESTPLSLQKKELSIIHVKLQWTKAVDLDLHAFYKTKSGQFGHVYFGNKGELNHEPYILLDQDAGVGNTAGNNEENLKIKNLPHFSSIIIATNIFRFLGFLNQGDHFAKYDGRVILQTDAGQEVTVPLVSEEQGRWCLIAKIDHSGSIPQVININRVQKEEPGPEAL